VFSLLLIQSSPNPNEIVKTQILLVAISALPLSAFAGDVTGTWKAEFETQR